MKFAQGEATSEQREALIVAAEAFVRSGEKTTAEQVASVTSSEMPGKEAV
jgi:hypothetical protein